MLNPQVETSFNDELKEEVLYAVILNQGAFIEGSAAKSKKPPYHMDHDLAHSLR